MIQSHKETEGNCAELLQATGNWYVVEIWREQSETRRDNLAFVRALISWMEYQPPIYSIPFAVCCWTQKAAVTLDEVKLTIDQMSSALLTFGPCCTCMKMWSVFRLLNLTQIFKCIDLLEDACLVKMRHILALPEKCKSLNIEQELSLWLYLQHSGRSQSLAYPFSVVTLFFCFLESLSWNRKPDVLFTGLSAWEVSDCVWEWFFWPCLWWVGWSMCDGMSPWHIFRGRQGFCLVSLCFDLISTLTCSHHLSSVRGWKFSHLNFSVSLLSDSVAVSSFLCLTRVW